MRKSVLPLLLATMLSACGLKGPLYLPEQKPAASPPSDAALTNGKRPEDKKTPASK